MSKEQTKIATSLITKTMAEDCGAADTLYVKKEEFGISHITKVFKSVIERFNIKSATLLGAGSYGVAYSIGNGKVFKITSDELEIDAGSKVMNANLKYVGKYYEVGFSKSLELGFIVMKEYDALNIGDYYLGLYDNLSTYEKGLIQNQSDRDLVVKINEIINDMNIRLYYVKEHVRKALYENFSWSMYRKLLDNPNERLFNTIRLFIDSQYAINELKKIGIEWEDSHINNFALDKDGTHVVIDVGTAQTNEASDFIRFESLSLGKIFYE